MMKRGSWTITAPVAIGSVLFVVFLFLPAKREADRLRAELYQQREFIHSSEALKPVIDELDRDLERARKYVARWQKQTPAESEIPRVYEQVNRQIQLTGARVARFEPKEGTRLDTLQLLDVNLDAAGTYSQILDMLARLEQLPHGLWLENVELRPGQDGLNVTCAAKMVVFAKNSLNSD